MKLNDLFYTVQGEGKNAGRAALFIRLPFCNLSCPWCDTEFDSFTEISDAELDKALETCASRFAVITGGEPAMNKETPRLLGILKDRGFEVAMESNGQFPVPDGVDHLTVSPKRWTTKTGTAGPRPPFWFDPSNRPSELKLVFDEAMEGSVPGKIYEKWLRKEFSFKDDSDPRFYLSPEWNAKERVCSKMVKYIQENPQWRVSLQSHKILGVK